MNSVSTLLSRSVLGVIALSLAATMGCSIVSSDEDSDATDSELRKKPTATENWSSLTVQLPTGSCQPGGSCSHPLGATATITLDGASVALGAASRIKPGGHTLTVNGASTTVTLAAGASKTLTLPTAHRKCQPASLPNVSQTDFGQSVTLSNAACPTTATIVPQSGSSTKPNITLHYYNWGCPSGNVTGTLTPSTSSSTCTGLRSDRVYSVNVNGQCIDLRQTRSDGQYGINPLEACNAYVSGDTSWVQFGAATASSFQDYDLAFVPGDYSIAIGSGTGATTQTFTLKEGDTKEIGVALPVIGSVPATFATNISFDDARELPDAKVATITSSCSGDRSYSLPATSTTTLKLKAFQASSCVYTFTAGGRTITLNQAATNTINLKRLDIDNVEITRENGSTYTVTGTYEIYFGGTRVAGPYNTNTGVDLLPGTYELVTSFSTADGPQTQRETINL